MFTFVNLVFQVEIEGAAGDPFAFYRFKGVFPESFLRSARRLRDRDGYGTVFAQALTPDPLALKRFQKPPLPFSFRLPALPRDDKGKYCCEISLSLAGSAVNHLESFIGAVKSSLQTIASEEGFSASVIALQTLGPDRSRTPLSQDLCELALLSDKDFNALIPGEINELAVKLLTPLTLVHDGRSLTRLDFSSFIRPLMRRVSSLAYYYSGSELEVDFRELAERSIDVTTVATRLTRERRQGAGWGILGEVVFSGPIQRYLQIMLIGEQFNLGKGASYGMGAFSLGLSI